ncbi:hypothetical protein TcCL_NonESM06513, partial [Trypanosoma cruzi]
MCAHCGGHRRGVIPPSGLGVYIHLHVRLHNSRGGGFWTPPATPTRREGLALRLAAGRGGWRPTPTTEARRTQSAPPSALSRQAPSHPRALAMGNKKNRRHGPSVPLAGKKMKKKWGRVSSTAGRGIIKRDTETHGGSGHGTDGK